jgi:hypothetical protein
MASTKFAAGSTMKMDGTDAHSWFQQDASTFSMRKGPNYTKTGEKAPSAKSMYDLVGVDFVKTPTRIDNFGSKVHIPDEWTNIDTHQPGVPPLFIINAQLPSDFTTSFFKEVTDGDGWSLVFYYKITIETADALKSLPTAPPAVQLFAKYCADAPPSTSLASAGDATATKKKSGLFSSSSSSSGGSSNSTSSTSGEFWKGRFKITLRCENMEKFGLPSFITAYNAKPVLIKNTGKLFRDIGCSYAEMDINIHSFASVPKKALEVLFSRFENMIIAVGFCIESRTDEDMPEALFGSALLTRPQHTLAPTMAQAAAAAPASA